MVNTSSSVKKRSTYDALREKKIHLNAAVLVSFLTKYIYIEPWKPHPSFKVTVASKNLKNKACMQANGEVYVDTTHV